MTVQVVVTRPRDEAEALARELTCRGYAPLIAPMLDIEILKVPVPALDRYGALAFTSANGARAFAARTPERALPAFAVGDTTAAVLRAEGFRDVRAAEGDAGALASLLAASAERRPILHVSGRAVARDLGALLAPAGFAVDRLELYAARTARILPADLVAAMYACTVDCVLFFSTRTAMTFGTLLHRAGLWQMVSSTTAICLSAQVSAGAAGLPWKMVRTAERPRTPEMLALLPPIAAAGQDRT